MDAFISLSCLIPEEDDEELATVLAASSTLGAWLQPRRDGLLRAVVYLDPSASEEAAALEEALERIGARELSTERVAARDWLREYRRAARPFAVGRRWWVDPRPGGSGTPPEGRIRLRMEPSAAFGSGSHESTRLALEALEDLPVRGTAVLDLGTGSGILALAAEALGARLVLAVDIDPVAVWVARRVRRQQEWEGRAALVVGTVAAVAEARFDVVLCNVLTSTMGPLLPEIRDRMSPGGRAILSGMLASELEAMRHATARSGLVIRRETTLGEWAALEVEGG